jgi:hypothetical protein
VIDLGDYRAISDIGSSLINLIWGNIKNDKDFLANVGLESQNQISLSSPDEDTGQRATLTLFLYHINEDTNLKNQASEQIWPDKSRRPPLPLSLFYMITPNTKSNEKNHLLLGRVLQIFNDNPIVRSPVLQASLAGEEIKLIFSSLSLDDINKIWSIVSKSRSYNLSAYYEVTPVRIASKESETARRVREAELKFGFGGTNERSR